MGGFYQTFKGELTSVLLKFFQTIEEDIQTHFIRPVLSSYQHQERTLQENYRPASPTNINIEILNKMLPNQIE